LVRIDQRSHPGAIQDRCTSSQSVSDIARGALGDIVVDSFPWGNVEICLHVRRDYLLRAPAQCQGHGLS
jgi:hypothetical protein